MHAAMNLNLSVRFLQLLCTASIFLNVVQWMQPHRQFDCECSCANEIPAAPAKPEPVQEWKEGKLIGPPEDLDSGASRELWCAEKYPVNEDEIAYTTVEVAADIPSFRMAVYKENDIISQLLLAGNVYRGVLIEMALLKYSNKEYMRGKIVIDAGANLGLFTLSALALGYEVVAFEPLESNYKMLIHNACINGYMDQLHVFPYGLGNTNRNCWVVSSVVNIGDGRSACTEAERDDMTKKPNAKNETYVVRGKPKFVKLDDYVPPKKKVGLMKLDVEGFENYVMAHSAIRRLFGDHGLRPPVIFGELYHSYLGDGCARGDSPYIINMLNREYVLTTPGGQSFLSTLLDVCKSPPQHIVWIDKAHWSMFNQTDA